MLIHPAPDFKYPHEPEVLVIVYVPLLVIHPTFFESALGSLRMFNASTVTLTLNSLFVAVVAGFDSVADVMEEVLVIEAMSFLN